MEKLKEHRGKTYGSIEEELESARKNLEMVSEAKWSFDQKRNETGTRQMNY